MILHYLRTYQLFRRIYGSAKIVEFGTEITDDPPCPALTSVAS